MIIFLTICYTAIVLLLVKLKIIKFSIGWKLSPLFFMLICFFVLIFPMQWGAPEGTVNVFRYVVEVMPNVSGEVIDIPAKPLKPMKKGDVLFQIDPRPFVNEVTRLEAMLKEAEQAALMLPVDLDTAKSSVARAEAALVDAKQQVEVLRVSVESAKATVHKAEAQLQLAQDNFNRTKQLFESQAASETELDTEQRNLDLAKATLEETQAQQEQAEINYGSRIGGVNTLIVQADENLRSAQSAETKSRLALESTVHGTNTTVARLQAELKLARLNLDWTTVRAPDDGYMVQVSLRPGQRVLSSSTRSWLAYVVEKQTRIVAWIKQYQLRHVKTGQPVEVEFKLYPGQTFKATVAEVIQINRTGQLQATGVVQDPTATPRFEQEYGVVLSLAPDNPVKLTDLPGGAVGSAAIYTDHTQMTHIIRRVEMRMKSWMNYIIP